MLIHVLSAIHQITTMMFGICLSAFLLGVRQNRRNICVLFLFFCNDGLIFLIITLLFGIEISNRIYPLVVHLPVILFLHIRQLLSFENYYLRHQIMIL